MRRGEFRLHPRGREGRLNRGNGKPLVFSGFQVNIVYDKSDSALSLFGTMTLSRLLRLVVAASMVFVGTVSGYPRTAHAALSFCNRSAVAIEAALGYRDETDSKTESWTSEGWWRIEPGQCARVYGQNLAQRFYFYYAHALAQTAKDTPPTTWSGKYIFCTDTKAFRVEGDNDCAARNHQSTGFQELDIGANVRDYTLDFKDGGGR